MEARCLGGTASRNSASGCAARLGSRSCSAGGKARLADARLAREQHHLPLAAPWPATPAARAAARSPPRARPAASAPPRAAPRTGSRPRSRRSTCQAWTGSAKPFSVDGAEIAVVEQPADEPARGSRDHDRVRARQGPAGARRGSASRRRRRAPALRPSRSDRRRPPARWRCRRGPAAHARLGLELGRRPRPSCKPGAHRPLGVVLVRLRIAEIDEHAVAHVLGDEAVEAGDRLGARSDDRRAMTSRRSSGSSRAASAVEPTRSQNITVSWRRSAPSPIDGRRTDQRSLLRPVGEASVAIAFSSRLRCPSTTPSFSRSASVSSDRTWRHQWHCS